MNTEQLQALERQFEKAKRADGPQSLATFATENAPALFEGVRRGISFAEDAGAALASDLAAIAALYPGVEVEALLAHAAADIKALRADRAKRAGYGDSAEIPDEMLDRLQPARRPEASGGFEQADYVAALRPLARLGEPDVQATIAKAAGAAGLEWDGEILVTVADEGEVLAQISKAQAERALTIVSAFEGEN